VPPAVATPVPRVSSPLPGPRPKKAKKLITRPSMRVGMLSGAPVPPINVLIVEDNIINLKLLEAFMKRLKVRWQTAMNGKEAMTKWRTGGFHLVLMDIQLPVMNGLEATREIRRLEKLNGIGVFSSSAISTAPEQAVEPQGEDKLPTTLLFKSPVIIVALTASSLQSDRHEALAAGCNDFLTKVGLHVHSPHSSCPLRLELTTPQPVNFVWLERKVMEWGCMQALIDFDGWRKWKDFSATEEAQLASSEAPSKKGSGASGGKGKSKKSRLSANRESVAQSATIKEENEEGKQ
jgi:osomolarity two-component system response regulator SSK1